MNEIRAWGMESVIMGALVSTCIVKRRVEVALQEDEREEVRQSVSD